MRQVKLITEISEHYIDRGSEALEHKINHALAEGWNLRGIQVAISPDGSDGWICVMLATLEADFDAEEGGESE